jgi:hypothetical protein
LIAACVVARKVEWIRNACLAAVLLFPAVAALHAIVLAVLHVDGEFVQLAISTLHRIFPKQRKI